MDHLSYIRKLSMKWEIINAASESASSARVYKRMRQEMDIMVTTEEGAPLKEFYDIWQKYKKNKITGHENKLNCWTAYCLGITDKQPPMGADFICQKRQHSPVPDVADFPKDIRCAGKPIKTSAKVQSRFHLYQDMIQNDIEAYLASIGKNPCVEITDKPVCPDCKGTGEYIGLLSKSVCKTCKGTKHV